MHARLLLMAAILGTIGCSDDSSNTPATPDAPTSSSMTIHVDRAHLSNVGTAAAPLDYSDPALWLCRPDIDANECARNIDATEVLTDNSLRAAPHVPAA